ncbi:MAG: FAD-binding protein [Bacteroidia bacterium]|nr:FAD-binding protein [Bacteroidia bacterium]MDW8345924.1 FAD-binding protein [Bacteroidia bacterium]
MQIEKEIKVLPHIQADFCQLKEFVAQNCGIKKDDITHIQILKRSIDSRGKMPVFVLKVRIYVDEPFSEKQELIFYPDVSRAKNEVVIIGAGPAGLFAALQLIELGIKPIIFERGKDVRSRRIDLANINKKGIVNPNSNYCFGEGGAGTYSDGKLYTRSHKRGDIQKILRIFVQHGASQDILIDTHPHIGTNKLPKIIQNIRSTILNAGGELHFEHWVKDFFIQENKVKSILIEHIPSQKEIEYPVQQLILATGHSARDIYDWFYQKNYCIEAKPFALGVRIEHPQKVIDVIRYHQYPRSEYLPASSYSCAHQVNGRGVFSFCMCPGGFIVPAATAQQELVVNGMSPSKRDSYFANSGIVVAVEPQDIPGTSPLRLLEFQKQIEYVCYRAGGGNQVAPAQRLMDFIHQKISDDLNPSSYIPGLKSVNLWAILPDFITTRLKDAFLAFGKQMKGYLTQEAQLVAPESRTSTPVRIPRDKDKKHHPQIYNLYPCGEGGGYAGGIVSAALEGQNIAKIIATHI